MNSFAGKVPASRKGRQPQRRSLTERIDLWLGFTGPSGMANRVGFYLDLAAFAEQGLTPMATVRRLNGVASKRRSLKWLKLVTDDLIASSNDGYSSFGAQLGRLVDASEAAMVTTGERAGEFPETMRMLAEMVRRHAAVSTEIVGLVRDVASYGALCIGVVATVSKVLAPKFLSIISPEAFAKLQFAPKFLALCQALTEWWLPVLLIGIAIVAGAISSLKRWLPSDIRAFADQHVAPWSVYSRTRSSLFLATLSTSLQAGGQFKETVQILHDSSTGWERAHMRRMLSKVAGAGGVPAAMGAGFLSSEVMDRLAIYLSANGFEAILRSLANDSIDGLLKSVRLVGRITKVGSILLVIAMLAATIGTGGEIALNGMQSSGAAI